MVRELFAMSLEDREIAFMCLGYAAVILRVEDRTVAIDVGDLLTDEEMAAFEDLALLIFTHNHWDHYDLRATVKILEKTDAKIVAQQQVAEDLRGKIPSNRLIAAKPRTTLSVDDFEINAVDGIHPRPISVYRIEKGTSSIFHGGDSGYVPVKDYPANLAFLPTGSPSPTCSPENALSFTLDLKPKVAVAMHGTPTQMNKYKKIVEKRMPDTSVIIPKKYEPKKVTL